MIRKVHVSASKNYSILIGQSLIANVADFVLDVHKPCKVLIVTDSTVNALYGQVVLDSFKSVGFEVSIFEFTPGEESKCLNTINDIVEFLASNEFTRSDLIVALGGGIVGDISGFAASIYQRGIEFIQIPTTLLAAVDSSVGGKTGVNLKAGKNLAGAFWQPSLVICDCNVFKTLPYDIFLDGIAEAIKYGCITDRSLFDLIKSEGRSLYESVCNSAKVTTNKTAADSDCELRKSDVSTDTDSGADCELHYPHAKANNETLIQIIERCVQIKADIVAEDERDTGVRQLLNFGHTIGHAIEKVSQYEISHGHAVAMGMLIVARACAKQELCAEECPDAIESVLTEFGFPTVCPYSSAALLDGALKDKKRAGHAITLIVPKTIGNCVLHKIPIERLSDFIVNC